MLWWRTALQWLFAATMLLATALTFVVVVPVVVLCEKLRDRSRRSGAPLAVLALALIAAPLALAGCDASVALNRTENVISQAREFATGAPAAPFDQVGNAQALDRAASEAGLQLTGTQLALILGAAEAVGVSAQQLAYVVEWELRHLDDGELDRDVLGALAGENTSVGIGQVRISTAREVEQEDRWDLFPSASSTADSTSETERVRRLAADGWSVLYAAAYLFLLEERFPGDQPLDGAVRYTGADPLQTSGDEALYDLVGGVLEP